MNDFLKQRWVPPAGLAGFLLLLFVGERLIGEGAWRWILDIAGVLLFALSVQARMTGRAEWKVPPQVMGWSWRLLGGVVLALLLYAAGLPGILGKLHLSATAETGARTVLKVLWPMLLGIAVVPLAFLDGSLIAHARAPALDVRRLAASARTGLALALLAAIFGLTGYLAEDHPVEHDFSVRSVGHPSEATLSIAENLAEPVYLGSFFPDGNAVAEEIDPYLRGLERSGGKLVVERFDQVMSPEVAKRTNVRENGVLFFSKSDPKVAGPPSITGDSYRLGTELEAAKFNLKNLDSEVQKRLLKVTRGAKKVYFTSGHGERDALGDKIDPNDTRPKLTDLVTWLRSQSVEVEKLSAANGLTSVVPADANMVVIAGPTQPFDPSETEAIDKWFDGGGHLLVLLEPGSLPSSSQLGPGHAPAGPDPTGVLEHLGLTFDPTLAANAGQAHFPMHHNESDNVLLVTNRFGSHASVTTISRHAGQLALFLPKTGTLAKKEGTTQNVQMTVKSMPGTFKDKNGNFVMDGDERAVDDLAFVAAVEKAGAGGAGKDARAVVSATTDLFSDMVVRYQANGVLGGDTFHWLLGEEQFQAKTEIADDVPVAHTRKQDVLWFYGTIFFAPALVLAGGLGFVGWSRRAA